MLTDSIRNKKVLYLKFCWQTIKFYFSWARGGYSPYPPYLRHWLIGATLSECMHYFHVSQPSQLGYLGWCLIPVKIVTLPLTKLCTYESERATDVHNSRGSLPARSTSIIEMSWWTIHVIWKNRVSKIQYDRKSTHRINRTSHFSDTLKAAYVLFSHIRLSQLCYLVLRTTRVETFYTSAIKALSPNFRYTATVSHIHTL